MFQRLAAIQVHLFPLYFNRLSLKMFSFMLRRAHPGTFVLSMIGALLLSLVSPLYAYTVQPLVFTLDTNGSGAGRVVTIANDQNTDITIQISMYSMEVTPQGEENRRLAEEDFLVFPPQAVVDAGRNQNFRVKYIGDPSIGESAVYRMHVEQIPIDVEKAAEGETKIGVQLLANFWGLLNVKPKGAIANVTVDSIKATGSDKWRLSLSNTGTDFARLQKADWLFDDGDAQTLVKGSDLGDFGVSSILPGGKRILEITPPNGFDPAKTKIEVGVSDKQKELLANRK